MCFCMLINFRTKNGECVFMPRNNFIDCFSNVPQNLYLYTYMYEYKYIYIILVMTSPKRTEAIVKRNAVKQIMLKMQKSLLKFM